MSSENRFTRFGLMLYLFVFTQFRTKGHGEVAEPKRYALFPELL